MKPNVLFVCIHNSARSQMAEAFLKQIAGDALNVYSAGLEAGSLNPLAVQVMQEIGIDISRNRTKTVNDPVITTKSYDYVVTVCQESKAGACPIFPTKGSRIAWHFADPGEFTGSEDQKLRATRHVRDRIKKRVCEFYEAIRSETGVAGAAAG